MDNVLRAKLLSSAIVGGSSELILLTEKLKLTSGSFPTILLRGFNTTLRVILLSPVKGLSMEQSCRVKPLGCRISGGSLQLRDTCMHVVIVIIIVNRLYRVRFQNLHNIIM